MKILYISVHASLEYAEVKLLTELGHDVFSIQGAYSDPAGHPTLPRPGIPEMTYHEEWDRESRLFPRTEIPNSFLNNFDLILVMHAPNILSENWSRLKGRRVVWRSIGQSTQGVEEALTPLRNTGLRIIRMSPKEANIPKYMGSDEMIRFYQDEDELKDWNGKDKQVINFSQSLKGRRQFCHYDHIIEMMSGFPAKVYGTGNEDLGNLNGGELSWEMMKGKLRDARVFISAGTWPSPYTLAPSEAMMTGIPLVVIGRRLAEEGFGNPELHYYEMEDIIKNGENGFISDDMTALRSYITQLLEDHSLAQAIGQRGRATAIELFSKEKIKEQWRKFLENI